jgi:hypothetical protein
MKRKVIVVDCRLEQGIPREREHVSHLNPSHPWDLRDAQPGQEESWEGHILSTCLCPDLSWACRKNREEGT